MVNNTVCYNVLANCCLVLRGKRFQDVSIDATDAWW